MNIGKTRKATKGGTGKKSPGTYKLIVLLFFVIAFCFGLRDRIARSRPINDVCQHTQYGVNEMEYFGFF